MTPKNLTQFFDALQNNEEFRKEFVQLAARHGVDFTAEDEQLSEEELAGVAGGNMTTLNDSDLLHLQMAMQKHQEAIQMMSNMSKMLRDTQKSIIQNLR